MEYQTITEIIEALKDAKIVYNDADFCRKTGLQPSFVSEMKTGKKPFSDLSRRKIEETFPEFFDPKTVDMTDPMSDLIALARFNIERGHDEIDRLITLMEKREGITKKEKSA